MIQGSPKVAPLSGACLQGSPNHSGPHPCTPFWGSGGRGPWPLGCVGSRNGVPPLTVSPFCCRRAAPPRPLRSPPPRQPCPPSETALVSLAPRDEGWGQCKLVRLGDSGAGQCGQMDGSVDRDGNVDRPMGVWTEGWQYGQRDDSMDRGMGVWIDGWEYG